MVSQRTLSYVCGSCGTPTFTPHVRKKLSGVDNGAPQLQETKSEPFD